MIGIQIFGVLFALVMIYFSMLYYKRKNYGKASLGLWLSVWIGLIIVLVIPALISSVMRWLSISRAVDAYVTVALVLITGIVFYLYGLVKKMEKQMEKLVRAQALKKK